MLAPSLHHAAHTDFVSTSPDTRLPVSINQQDLSAALHHPRQLGECRVQVSHVFIDLRGQSNLKRTIRKRQLQHISLVKRHLLGMFTATCRQLQHGRGDINGINTPLVTHHLRQRQRSQAWAAADIQGLHAGLDLQQLKNLLALLHHIGGEVDFFQPLGTSLVKLRQGTVFVTHALLSKYRLHVVR